MKPHFSSQLVKLRKEQGMSQDELAEKLFITRQAISKWERGETTPDLAKIEQIAEVFGVTTEFLLFGRNFEDDWGLNHMNTEEASGEKNDHVSEWLSLFKSHWWLLFPLSGLLFALIDHLGKLLK